MTDNKGYALLIVTILICLFVFFVLPKIGKITEKAVISEARTALSNIRSAQMRYQLQYGVFTSNIDALDCELDEKYFHYEAINGTSEVLGKASRNTSGEVYLGEGITGYDLEVRRDGSLNISSGLDYLL